MSTLDDNDASTFSYNAMAAVAKAVVFRCLSVGALANSERIVTSICSYYSILHLAIALMYLCPQRIPAKLRQELLKERRDGTVDPSKIITHDKAAAFMHDNLSYVLRGRLAPFLQEARDIRELFNYGPRITVVDHQAFLGPCGFRPDSADRIVRSLDEVFIEALTWARDNAPLNAAILHHSIENGSDFFNEPDLFYVEWCSAACTNDALDFLGELRNAIPYAPRN